MFLLLLLFFLQYACDGDDKTWLYENKHLPVHGGKVKNILVSSSAVCQQRVPHDEKHRHFLIFLSFGPALSCPL